MSLQPSRLDHQRNFQLVQLSGEASQSGCFHQIIHVNTSSAATMTQVELEFTVNRQGNFR